MTLTVITPTCDRPFGFALLEQYMARQTRLPDQWVIADGGHTAVTLSRDLLPSVEICYSRVPAPPGALNLCANLHRAAEHARGDLIAFAEDDDWYAPTHLQTLEQQLLQPDALAAGDHLQRYYNIEKRMWRVFQNRGSSLCQTGFLRALLPTFQDCVQYCFEAGEYGIDGAFWQKVPKSGWALAHTATVVGLKGLPGQTGLGVGHRPDPRKGWQHDPDLRQLQAWIGDDLPRYC